MTGKRVKEILKDRGYKLAFVAESMGIIPQNLQSLLNVDDIKTGVLERIADAINESILIFFADKFPKVDVSKLAHEYVENVVDIQQKMAERGYFGGVPGEATRKDPAETAGKNENSRLWTVIESQQRQLESQQRVIETLTNRVSDSNSVNYPPPTRRPVITAPQPKTNPVKK